jgi:hypothetical protein
MFTYVYLCLPRTDGSKPTTGKTMEPRTDGSKPTTGKTMELLEITRKYNYFEFGDILYKQEGGTSIGKKHAPDTACLGARV